MQGFSGGLVSLDRTRFRAHGGIGSRTCGWSLSNPLTTLLVTSRAETNLPQMGGWDAEMAAGWTLAEGSDRPGCSRRRRYSTMDGQGAGDGHRFCSAARQEKRFHLARSAALVTWRSWLDLLRACSLGRVQPCSRHAVKGRAARVRWSRRPWS